MQEYTITLKEKDSIRFYQGDVRERDENGHLLDSKEREGFYGIKSAYKTLNCLMFSGIENEQERISEKMTALAPQILCEVEKVLDVYSDLYRAMCKFSLSQERKERRFLYRTERGVSAEELKKGRLISFTSTSLERNPEEFLKKKSDLTLLEIVLPKTVPHLDFQEVLGEEYFFSNQKEVLLPPYLNIEMVEMELSNEEQEYRDIHQKPPKGKYLIFIKEEREKNKQSVSESGQAVTHLTESRNQRASAILGKLNCGEILTEQEIKEYCQWKEDFQELVRRNFNQIWKEYYGEREKIDLREKALKEEVRERIKEWREKEKDYKRKLMLCNVSLALSSLLPIICMALSFFEGYETVMKCLAVVTSALAILLTRMIKIEAYGLKLVQRTKTYLALCDLHREMKYETDWGKEKTNFYVQKFRKIMQEDTEMSLQNLQIQVNNGEALFQNELSYKQDVLQIK